MGHPLKDLEVDKVQRQEMPQQVVQVAERALLEVVLHPLTEVDKVQPSQMEMDLQLLEVVKEQDLQTLVLEDPQQLDLEQEVPKLLELLLLQVKGKGLDLQVEDQSLLVGQVEDLLHLMEVDQHLGQDREVVQLPLGVPLEQDQLLLQLVLVALLYLRS